MARVGRLCPWCWPWSWKAHSLAVPSGPFVCLLEPRCRRFLRWFSHVTVLSFLVIVLVLWLGMSYEQAQVRKLPDTVYLYTTPAVCGITYNQSSIETETYASVTQVQRFIASERTAVNDTSKTVIAHCGACGQCSTPHDIAIYDKTRNTLFKDSIVCAHRGLFGGSRAASRCMGERVGLSSGCNDCWVENIMCDLRKCIFSCFYHSLFSGGGRVHDGSAQPQALNICTQCDESRCGPAFLQCAGANRRRTAIESDIRRDIKEEICANVQADWWQDLEVQAVWQHEYGSTVTTGQREGRLHQRLRGSREERNNSSSV